jgi:hypothetical protein
MPVAPLLEPYTPVPVTVEPETPYVLSDHAGHGASSFDAGAAAAHRAGST